MRKQQYRVSESKISIHAPAEGVTSPKKDNDAGRNISIHAPAEGATRRPVGKWRCKKISIHAPAEGATQPRVHRHIRRRDFNPRSRGGSDLQPQRRPS